MVEAKRGSPASVLQGLSGEGLIVAVDKAEDQEEELEARTCSKDLWPHWSNEAAWSTAYIGCTPLRRASYFPAAQGTDNRLT